MIKYFKDYAQRLLYRSSQVILKCRRSFLCCFTDAVSVARDIANNFHLHAYKDVRVSIVNPQVQCLLPTYHPSVHNLTFFPFIGHVSSHWDLKLVMIIRSLL